MPEKYKVACVVYNSFKQKEYRKYRREYKEGCLRLFLACGNLPVLHVSKCEDCAIEYCLPVEQGVANACNVCAVVKGVRAFAVVEHAFYAFGKAATIHNEHIGHAYEV